MSEVFTEFSAKERLVAADLGISRNVIRGLREKLLQEGRHWKKEGREIMYTPEAIQMLRNDLKLRSQPDVSNSEKNGEGDAQCALSDKKTAIPDLKKARVTSVTKNRHILLADLDGVSIRVRVNDSKNFVQGMEVRCQVIEEDLYELVGRCPRGRGVW